MLALFSLAVFWFFLGGRERIRSEIVSNLRPLLGETFDLSSISLYPRSVVLHDVTLDPAPNLHINLKAASIRLSPYDLLQGVFDWEGAIEEIELIEPRFSIVSTDSSDTLANIFVYKPYALRQLSALKVIRRIRVIEGSVVSDRADRMLVEQITGQIDLIDPTHSVLNMKATIPSLGQTDINVDGSADVTTGEFFATIRTEIPELQKTHIADKFENLELISGKLALTIDVWGGADLRYGGKFYGDNISANFDDKLEISAGTFTGDIFGQMVRLDGEVLLSENEVKFRATIDDLFNRSWSASLTSRMDLATVDDVLDSEAGLEGGVDLTASLIGLGDHWGGSVELESDRIGISGVNLDEIHSLITIHDGVVTTDAFSTYIENGKLNITGEADFSTGNVDLKGQFLKKWSIHETPLWSSISSPELSVVFDVTREEDEWRGGGEGSIMDEKGAKRLELLMTLADNELEVRSESKAEQRGSLSFSYNFEDEIPLLLSVRDPQYLLQDIVKSGYLPDKLFQYDIKIDVRGTSSDLEGSVIAESLNPLSGAELRWKVSKIGTDWVGSFTTVINLQNRQKLRGGANVKISSQSIELSKGTLKTSDGEEVLAANVFYQLPLHRYEKFDVTATNFPVIGILRLAFSNIETGLTAKSDFKISAQDGNVAWKGISDIAFSDEVTYILESEGVMEDNVITVIQATLSNTASDSQFFKASGSYNFLAKRFDSVVVSLTQFSAERAIALAAPKLSGKFGGLINAHLELSGPLSSPSLSTDIHVTSGIIYSDPGYWANMSLKGDSGKYQIVRLNLGYKISSLLTGSGDYNSDKNRINFTASGRDGEVGRLVKAFSGLNIPISGKGDFSINLDNTDTSRQARGTLSMNSGKLGPLSFRNLSANVSLSGLNSHNPVLNFDSLIVDWGEAFGTVSGELPLTSQRSIDMDIALEGRLMKFLPQLTPLFSNSVGEGSLDLHLGGTIKKPRFVDGQLIMHKGGVELDQVIRNVGNLEADISLDSLGKVGINRLDFTIDDAPVTISNRDANPFKGEEPMVVFGYNIGVFQILTEPDGFWIVIAGLMEKSWGGYLALSGDYKSGMFELTGPANRPHAYGQLNLRNAIVTYPMLHMGGHIPSSTKAIMGWLSRIRLHTRLTPDLGCRYFREVSGLGELRGWGEIKNQIGGGLLDPDLKITIDLRIDDNPVGIIFNGFFSDSLQMSGELTSVQGTVEFLDLNFDVEKAGIEFNPALIDPILYGTATTTVIDSSGISRQVRIRLMSGSSEARAEDRSERAHFSDLTIIFEDDQGHSQEQVLALLGYTPEHLPEKLSGLGGQFVESATPLKKWQRGFERILEQWTGLDRIAVQTNVAQNFIERQINPINNINQQGGGSYWNLLYGSRVTLGKYVLPNLYLSYTGALASQTETYEQTRLGILHSWDANYRLTKISNNLVLNYRYEYNELARSSANSILIRYGWVFDLQSHLAKVWK